MSAVVPEMRRRIDEPRDVRRMVLRLEGASVAGPDLDGVGQSVDGSTIEIRDPRTLQPGPADPGAAAYLSPEPFLESDAPEIIAEANVALKGVTGARARAERLTRYVNALLDKKPTVSLPSAREVLRTKVGDCNEHTALYVAMARAAGIPARIAVGLVFVRGVQGAFYYHAWPEVYLDEGNGRGMWLPVDPDLQPVSGRRHAPSSGARRPRQAGGDPASHRTRCASRWSTLSSTRSPRRFSSGHEAIGPASGDRAGPRGPAPADVTNDRD